MTEPSTWLLTAREERERGSASLSAARTAVSASATLRVGIIDSSYDSMPHILHNVQARDPGLVIHQSRPACPGSTSDSPTVAWTSASARARTPRLRLPPTCSAATRGSDDHGSLTGYRIGCETTSPRRVSRPPGPRRYADESR